MNKPGPGLGRPPFSIPPPASDSGPTLLETAEHVTAATVVSSAPPLGGGPRSFPPPPPIPPRPPLSQSDPLSDLPTRQLLVSQPPLTEARPHLAPPPSWPEEEETAALLLPMSDFPPVLPASRQLPLLGQRAKRQWVVNLFMALGGAICMLVLLLVGVHIFRPAAPAPSAAATRMERQELLDDALRAVQAAELPQAIELLERFQRAQPAADPAVDRMIEALRRRSR